MWPHPSALPVLEQRGGQCEKGASFAQVPEAFCSPACPLFLSSTVSLWGRPPDPGPLGVIPFPSWLWGVTGLLCSDVPLGVAVPLQ